MFVWGLVVMGIYRFGDWSFVYGYLILHAFHNFGILCLVVWNVLGKENKMESQISMFRFVLDLKKMITIHLVRGLPSTLPLQGG